MSTGERYWKRLSLSICSFNVLCQIYEPQHLPNNQCSFHHRSHQILSQLRWANADVVALQECQPVSFYKRQLSAEYDILFVSKADSASHAPPSGVAPRNKAVATAAAINGGNSNGVNGNGNGATNSTSASTPNGTNNNGNQSPTFASSTTGALAVAPSVTSSNSSASTTPAAATGSFIAPPPAMNSSCDGDISEHEMRHNVNDSDDGAVMMFKKGTVELISCQRILLNEPITEKDSTLTPGPRRARQFALAAHVLHLASKKTFFVCAVHMKANGDRSEDAKRICHLKQIFKQLAVIRATDPNAPLFFCGDLNADPESQTMELLLTGRTTWNGTSHFLGQAALSSAMKEMCEGNEPQFTILDSSYGQGPWWNVLDYVLFEPSKSTPIAFLTPPTVDHYGSDAIPHSGSDHIPLVVEFVLGRVQ